MNIIDLKDATTLSGGKASGLALLNRMEVPVPSGFVINDTLNLSFDNDELEILKSFLSKLDQKKKLAIRSSACAEDGSEKSFAGIFETKLNVENNPLSVLNAIKEVNLSATTDVVSAYSGGQKQIMNIVIQEMVDPQLAGVLFTDAIDINGNDVVLFECVNELADKLVSGAANPAQIIAQTEENKISPESLRTQGALMDLTGLSNIFPLVNNIKSLSKIPLDIEWCIDKEGNPYFVQARPITSTVFINKPTENSGIVASRGYAEGTTFVIDENKSDDEIKKAIDEFPEGAILVAGITETLYMPAIRKAKGIITEEGSALSHAAIVSRELGIPCIAGYKGAISAFPTGTQIVLDASNGKVIANGKVDSLNTKKGFEFGELYCFDNAHNVNFGNFDVYFESTFGGLMLHMDSDDATPQNMEIVEKYARKVYGSSPEQHFDDKYLWYKEIERFEKLPFYRNMIEEMLEIAKTKDNKRLNEFYTNSLLMLTELVQYKNAYATDVEKLVINEIGAAVNLILDAMLPLGYALRQSYLDSIGILDLYNLSFNDLFIKEDFNINNDEILKIKSFLDNVSVNRNEVYEKICNIGATYPEYFEEREEILENAHFSNIEELYSFIENEELFGISNIMQPFFSKKKKKRSN